MFLQGKLIDYITFMDHVVYKLLSYRKPSDENLKHPPHPVI